MTTTAIKCPYCNYTFIADSSRPTTFCPNCKKTVLTTQPKQGVLSIFKKLPKNMKYVIIAALVIGIVYVILNMFGIV